jgi:SulP family sulfate permease
MVLPSFFISIVGFVSSISVAQTLASKRQQRIDPSQELVGLGAANIAAALTGGFPVAGGFARSIVNSDAGAETPAAGVFTALGVALASLFLTPALYFLPTTTLAATIVAAVVNLIDVPLIMDVWRYSRRDFVAMATTAVVTMVIGVEVGLAAGVLLSILLYLERASRPHLAIVGQVPGSQHFRNVDRHVVVTAPGLLSLRIDESLTFINAVWLEDKVIDLVSGQTPPRDVVLMFSAVNHIDASALERLHSLNSKLKTIGVGLHLSEVKGPVMDRLRRSSLMETLTGRIFLSQYDAFRALAPATCDSHPGIGENLWGEGI